MHRVILDTCQDVPQAARWRLSDGSAPAWAMLEGCQCKILKRAKRQPFARQACGPENSAPSELKRQVVADGLALPRARMPCIRSTSGGPGRHCTLNRCSIAAQSLLSEPRVDNSVPFSLGTRHRQLHLARTRDAWRVSATRLDLLHVLTPSSPPLE